MEGQGAGSRGRSWAGWTLDWNLGWVSQGPWSPGFPSELRRQLCGGRKSPHSGTTNCATFSMGISHPALQRECGSQPVGSLRVSIDLLYFCCVLPGNSLQWSCYGTWYNILFFEDKVIVGVSKSKRPKITKRGRGRRSHVLESLPCIMHSYSGVRVLLFPF